MSDRRLKATDPAAHHPTKADTEEDVNIDTTPEALAWAATRGGTERQKTIQPPATMRDEPVFACG